MLKCAGNARDVSSNRAPQHRIIARLAKLKLASWLEDAVQFKKLSRSIPHVVYPAQEAMLSQFNWSENPRPVMATILYLFFCCDRATSDRYSAANSGMPTYEIPKRSQCWEMLRALARLRACRGCTLSNKFRCII